MNTILMLTSGALPHFFIHLSEIVASKNLSHPKFMALYYRLTTILLASITYIMFVHTLYVISFLLRSA